MEKRRELKQALIIEIKRSHKKKVLDEIRTVKSNPALINGIKVGDPQQLLVNNTLDKMLEVLENSPDTDTIWLLKPFMVVMAMGGSLIELDQFIEDKFGLN